MHLAVSAPYPGAFVEIGVYQGESAKRLRKVAMRRQQPLFLYDTFEGIPHFNAEKGDRIPLGAFADTDFVGNPYDTVIKGIFPDTIVDMGPVAFVHADADQYQSTKDIIKHMVPRLVKKGMIVFDDFALEGCRRAVKESSIKVRVVRYDKAVYYHE